MKEETVISASVLKSLERARDELDSRLQKVLSEMEDARTTYDSLLARCDILRSKLSQLDSTIQSLGGQEHSAPVEPDSDVVSAIASMLSKGPMSMAELQVAMATTHKVSAAVVKNALKEDKFSHLGPKSKRTYVLRDQMYESVESVKAFRSS